MILGLGADICPASRWQHLLDRFGDKALRKVLCVEEADYLFQGNRQRLAERAAGRWALREAFGKALGVGLDGWSWKQLRFLDGRLWAEGELAMMIKSRGIDAIHGTVTHDGGTAFAVVILEKQHGSD